MHADIERDEIIERYVRRQLPPEELRAFEEHFFGCDECFEKVQEAERFQVGIRDAARRGLLDESSQPSRALGRERWLAWALASTACASLALMAITGWLYFGRLPRMREALNRSAAELDLERRSRAELPPTTIAADGPEANVALAMLVASRAGDKPAPTVLSPAARRLVLWIEVGPSSYRRFRIDVLTADNRQVATLNQLERGPYGALVASLPADGLPTGDLRIRLSGQDPPPASLVGDYQLRIEKR
jgi:anti-sigma factor RsiW